jgi:excisionase family DNA binding protein
VNENERMLPADGELLTEQQLADLWHTSARHIRRLRVEADLPYIKLGRLIRFDQRDIDHWLKTRKHAPIAS